MLDAILPFIERSSNSNSRLHRFAAHQGAACLPSSFVRITISISYNETRTLHNKQRQQQENSILTMDRLLSILLLLVVALLASSLVANGQEIGTELCACSPRSFEFQLDFSLTCPPINITIGNAVEATSCLVSPFGNQNVDDLVPVSVENIDVLELGQNLRVVSQTDIDQVFNDGDTFMYTSIVADPQSIEAAGDVPRALQLNIVGINSQGDKIINVFIVTFTNGCGSYPVFEEGQSAGWARFVSTREPSACFVDGSRDSR